jgi:hypothetical protein
MKISKELRERIKRLEEEQQQQSKELEDLSNLRDMVAIAELEQELMGISKSLSDNDKSAAQAQKDLDISKENLAAQVKGAKAKKGPDLKTDKDIDLEKEAFNKKKVTAKSGYVVCLMFNPTSPSEWAEEAGGGWRGRGLGTAYPDQKSAQMCLKQLKSKWPDYPIEIHPIQNKKK